MSNKKWNKLWEADRAIRKMFPTMMWNNDEIILTIEFFGGFEFFNTRPYHNYETWSEGYRVKAGTRYGEIVATAEDLDDAIRKLQQKLDVFSKPNHEDCPYCGENYLEKYCMCHAYEKVERFKNGEIHHVRCKDLPKGSRPEDPKECRCKKYPILLEEWADKDGEK